MSSGRRRRSFSRWSLDRLVAIWVAGLLGSFALGLYLFGLRAPEPDAKTGAASTEPPPAEIAVSGARPSVEPPVLPAIKSVTLRAQPKGR